MPTYVYRFVDTGETIEVQQSFTDPTLTETAHPRTGEMMAVKKVFQPVGVTFKGGGFYKTDSRGGSSKSSSTASSGSSESSGGDGGSPAPSTTSTSSTPASTATPSTSTSSTTSSGSSSTGG